MQRGRICLPLRQKQAGWRKRWFDIFIRNIVNADKERVIWRGSEFPQAAGPPTAPLILAVIFEGKR
jgi:hypothetical protein